MEVIRDGNKATLYMTEHDIFNHTCVYKTWQEFVSHQFDRNGLEVLSGLDLKRTDTEICTIFEISGNIGAQLREKKCNESPSLKTE